MGPAIAARQPRRVDLPLSSWGLEVDGDGRLARHGGALAELVEQFGSPLHVVDGDALERIATSAIRRGGADVFFSYKTNPVPGTLRILHAAGIGAEVISAYELWLAMRLGVPGERTIYNGPAKSPASLRIAVEHGVAAINANTSSELDLLRAAALAAGRAANVGLRVTLPGMWGGQFGIPGEAPQIRDAVDAARRDDRLRLRALHFHRGVRLRSASAFEAHVAQVIAWCVELRATTGWLPNLLDLGGSLATPTVDSIPTRQYRLNRALATDLLPPDPSDCLRVGEAALLAQQMVDAAFGDDRPVRAVLEPGRGLTGDTQLLLTSVVAINDDGPLPHVVLDAGINVAEPTSGEYHQVLHTSAPLARAARSYRLVGPICTPGDVLYHHWRLPPVAVGDVLALMDTGAYFVPFSTSFSFPRPAIVIQRRNGCTVARRAETFEDLADLDEL